MTDYKVINDANINYDGVLYVDGDIIYDLSDKQAEALAGLIEPVEKPPETRKTAKRKR